MHITWKKMADEVINSGWGQEETSLKEAIKSSSDGRIAMCILLDIAKTNREILSILNCRDFLDIPKKLDAIKKNTTKKRKKAKP